MHLHAAIALKGLSTDDVENVIEQIRCLLHDIDPNIEQVEVDVVSVGSQFGGHKIGSTRLTDLLQEAEALRRDLLGKFWSSREGRRIQESLRLGHVMASMNPARIQLMIDILKPY